MLVDPNGGTGTTLTLGSIATKFNTKGQTGRIMMLGKAAAAGSGTVSISTGVAATGGRILYTPDGGATVDYWDTTGPASYTTLPATGGSGTTYYSLSGGLNRTGTNNLGGIKIMPTGANQSLSLVAGVNQLISVLATGTDAYSITGGNIASPDTTGGSQFVVHQYNTGGLTISSVIEGAGGSGGTLFKSGPGKLTLTGANVHGDITWLAEGTLSLATISNGGNGTQYNLTASAGSTTITATSTTGLAAGMALARPNEFPNTARIASITNATTFEMDTPAAAAGSAVKSLVGFASNLGMAPSAAANLVIGEATLQYTGLTDTSDRAFTIQPDRTATFDITSATTNLTMAGATGTTSTGALTKTGAGTLTLTGTNTYSGATTVTAGTLRLNNPNSSNEASTVTIATGAALELNFVGTDTVDKLFIGTTPMAAGVYKAVGNPGTGTEIAQITGPGILIVGTGGAAIYTVTYDGNGNTGGTAPTDVSSPYENDAMVTLLENTGGLTKTGFLFSGWNTAADGTGTSYAASNTETLTMGSANVILYAKWISTTTHAVTYDGNGSTSGSAPVDSASYLNGATVTVRANTGALTKTGYILTGWNTAANGGGTSYAASGSATFTMGSADVTLFAQWAVPYAVTYDGNGSTGGSVPADSGAYVTGATVTVRANTGTLTKTGSAFSGWNTAVNGSGTPYAASGSATFTMGPANVTLYAQWAVPYSVTYDGNSSTGGTAPSDGATYATGATVTVRANTGTLTKTGFTLAGWNTAANGSGTSYAASGSATFTMGSANVTLYAQWTVPYSVTYDGNSSTGGTVPADSATYASGATVTVRANTGTLTKTGFTFTGWNTAANGSGTSYAASGSATLTIGSTNVILFAQWTVTFSVTYIGNGNTGGTVPVDSGTYATGALVTVRANTGTLTKTGFTLASWNTAANGSGTSYAVSGSATLTMGLANVTLYAQWAVPYTVTYDGNGSTSGTAPADTGTYVTGATVTVKANTGTLTKTGFTLACWNTAADGSGTGYAASGNARFTMNLASVTLYAQWGETSDYTYTIDSSKVIITGYTGSGGAVSVPDTINGMPVTSIGAYAFYAVTTLTSVTIPNGVTSIGDRAFQSCTGLTGVTIPASVTSIGNWAFQSCNKLTSLTIPNGVTSIGEATFYSCTSLASVTIPASVTHIGEWAFFNCGGLTVVAIPASVTSIGNWAFKSCTKLASVTIPSGVTQIANGVFEACTALASITIPNTVTSIGNSACYSCTSLAGITIPNNVTTIGVWAFASCSKLTSVTIPASVTFIGERAFDSCTLLTTATIPASVTTIGNGAFDSCPVLTGVTIPASVSNIGDWTFYSCAKLTGATIPNGVTRIGSGAFESCTGLTGVTIPASVTSIGDWAFKSCTQLADVTIPNGVTCIGDWTFASCSGLTSVTIPASVTRIGNGAFQSCALLTGLTIPASVTHIGDWAFQSCTGLTQAFFNGNAPGLGGLSVFAGDTATVYYLPSTTGWGATFGGLPTVPWNPQAQNLGMQANQFGFTITGSPGLVIVVEASTDLAIPVWVPVATKTLTGGSAYFSDPQSPGYPRRFYRFRPQ